MELFLTMDLYSYSPRLLYNQQTYKTIPGALMTLISLIFAIAFSLVELRNYIDGTKKSIIFAKESNFNNTIKINDILIGYSIYDQTLRPISKNMVTVFPVFWQVTSDIIASYSNLNSTNCINTKKYEENKKSDILKISDCIANNNENITLEQNSAPLISKYIALYITKCTNSSDSNNICLPEEEINKVVDSQGLFLALSIENANFNHDKKNPVSSGYLTSLIPISTDFISYETYKLRNLIYESDDGLITAKKHTYYSVIFETFGINDINYSTNFHMRFANTIKIIQIGVNENYAEKYTRRYEKIQDVLSSVSGICFSIIKIFSYLTKLITKGYMYRDLSKLIINDSDINKQEKNNNNLKTINNYYNSIDISLRKKSNIERSNNEQSNIMVIPQNINIRESKLKKNHIQNRNKKASSLKMVCNKESNSFDISRNQINNNREILKFMNRKSLSIIQFNEMNINENLDHKINKLNCFHLLLFSYYYCYYCNRSNEHAKNFHYLKKFIDENISANQIIRKLQAIK